MEQGTFAERLVWVSGQICAFSCANIAFAALMPGQSRQKALILAFCCPAFSIEQSRVNKNISPGSGAKQLITSLSMQGKLLVAGAAGPSVTLLPSTRLISSLSLTLHV